MRIRCPRRRHGGRLDAEITLNARKQRCIFFRFDYARLDSPIRGGPGEILPELLIELRLIADGIHSRHVGLHAAHHPRVGFLADVASGGFATEDGDPLLEANLARAAGGSVATPAKAASKFRRVRWGSDVVAITILSYATNMRLWRESVASVGAIDAPPEPDQACPILPSRHQGCWRNCRC